MRLRFVLGAVLVCLVRCQGCLPQLLPGDLNTLLDGVSGVSGFASGTCTSDTECAGALCCNGTCQLCCGSIDCPATDGIALLCASGTCLPCAPSGPTCSSGNVCCAPGHGNTALISACIAGSCCTDNDCATSPAGPRCVNNQCALSACSAGSCGAGSVCCDGACLAGSCCTSADCNGLVCIGNQCVTCSESTCAAGQMCCGGSCAPGNCCTPADCANPRLACVGNQCGACTSAGDCGGTACCMDPNLGNICLAANECCPNLANNVACDGATSPTGRACSTTSHTCGQCDAVTAPCAPGKLCCGGACIAPTGGACCTSADCTTGVCDPNAHQCVACIGGALCSTGPTGALVCDAASESCVACDGSHTCGGGNICCSGACFTGTCCSNADCGGQTPLCDVNAHACVGCQADGDCGFGGVCVAPGGVGPCPLGASGCLCESGTCHETQTLGSFDCAGACCNYQCFGQCCINSDCTLPNPGHQNGSVCQSAVNAAATMSCNGNVCGCPAPVGTNRTVDATLGNDATGNGSPECPWRSLTHALAAAPGTVVNVRPGTYDKTVELFPLDVPTGTTVQLDPTCASGIVAIVRNDGNTTACPVQRAGGGPRVSCAVSVHGSGVAMHNLNIKNTSGRALAFGTGADATTLIDSGVVGCEQAAATCARGSANGQNGNDDVLVAGSASPSLSGLALAPARGSALVVADQATPVVSSLANLFDFDGDVVVVEDNAQPSLTSLQMNWPAGPTGSNRATCVNISGSGPGMTMTSVWMHACGLGGVLLNRAASGSSVRHAFSDVRVDLSQGTPPNLGYGFSLSSPTDVSGVDISTAQITRNNGHGISVNQSNVTVSGTTIDKSGAAPAVGNACFGGNGIVLVSALSNVTVSATTINGTAGRLSPPPNGVPACDNGHGIDVRRGTLALQGSQSTNNASDGLYVEATAAGAVVGTSLFSGNGQNGIEVQEGAPANLGTCVGFPLVCTAGGNYFHCPIGASGASGNARANVCFVSRFAQRTLNAQGNQWQASPVIELDRNYAGANNHCAALGQTDTISLFGANGTNTVNTPPEEPDQICPP